jgi:hypothetical protein
MSNIEMRLRAWSCDSPCICMAAASIFAMAIPAEQHRQQAVGRYRCARGIELQLADRDAHAVGADVAEAQDAPARGNANEAHLPHRPVAQHFGDAAFHLAREVHATRAAKDVAEGEAGIGDRRVIEDRDEPRRVGHDRPIEERLVAVCQPDQIYVALNIAWLRVQLLQHALDLPLEAFHRLRQKPFEPVSAALLRSERGILVFGRVPEQWQPPELGMRCRLIWCSFFFCHCIFFSSLCRRYATLVLRR